MIRSTTSFLSAASTFPPSTTEPHGPGLSSFGPRSRVPRLPRRAGNIPPFAIFGRQVDGAAGGIPPKNPVLNQVYANVLGRTVLVPSENIVGVGSAIFAFLAAGTFRSIEDAQAKICPAHTVYLPQTDQQQAYETLFSVIEDCTTSSAVRRTKSLVTCCPR